MTTRSRHAQRLAVNILYSEPHTSRDIGPPAGARQRPAAACSSDGVSPAWLSACAVLTTTAGCVVPVTSADGKAVANGAPGSFTTRLHAAYWTLRDEGTMGDPVDYSADNPQEWLG